MYQLDIQVKSNAKFHEYERHNEKKEKNQKRNSLFIFQFSYRRSIETHCKD